MVDIKDLENESDHQNQNNENRKPQEEDEMPEVLNGFELLEYVGDENDNFIIKDLLPKGLTILAGNPKAGKSKFVRSLALDLTLGKKIFGYFESNAKCGVVYIPLEESLESIRKQVKRMLKNRIDVNMSDFKNNFNIATPEAGLHSIYELKEFIQDYYKILKPKLFICDPLGKVMNLNSYDEYKFFSNYQVFGPLQDLALELDIGILFVHHLRKSEANNPLNRMIGSVALSAVGSAGWVLEREFGESTGVLKISAKLMEDKVYKISFNKETLEWSFVGEFNDLNLTPEKQEIVELFLENSNIPIQTKDIANELGKKLSTVSSLLRKLVKSEILIKVGYGIYKLNEKIYSKLKEGGF